MNKPLIGILLALSIQTAFAHGFWMSGTFTDPNRSGVKKGDILEYLIGNAITQNVDDIISIGSLCDFNKRMFNIRTKDFNYIFCSYVGHVRG